jgi:hypothetical protein
MRKKWSLATATNKRTNDGSNLSILQIEMKTRIISYFRLAGIAVVLLCLPPVTAHADIITVTNTNDSGPGSLRQALSVANDE